MTFEAFYRERRKDDEGRDREPFPWMSRLARKFAANDLPDIIDLPTGSGKSDVVLIWAWARLQNKHLPRRLWMISDRRVIVDQTYDIANLLKDDERGKDGDNSKILINRLRGGIVGDDNAMLDPIAEQIITSTVDQFGSRLLFRAYGATPRAWPIWAGLAGNDSLVILDEAHLSPLAEDTFRACHALGANIRIISMTATPRTTADASRFELDATDRDHKTLGKRLAAKRIVELRNTGTAVQAAQELLDAGCTRVAVICNTVRAARRAFNDIEHADKHLIIGRQRDVDRKDIMERLIPRLKSGAAPTAPMVVVSTQCIEAGADFDFDGMVSEACPIDALRQRLGRLNRLGDHETSRCILLKPADLKNAPPYGSGPGATWRWLQKHAKKNMVDLGGAGWTMLVNSEPVPDDARSSRPDQVSLLQPHMRMLARTSPRPTVEPDIDLLLHGHDRAPAAVSIVWRNDIEIKGHEATDIELEAADEILHIIPPDSLEACDVPLWEVQAWLTMPRGATQVGDTGDVEGGMIAAPRDNGGKYDRAVFLWDGADNPLLTCAPRKLSPGQVIVIPANYGGYDGYGWDPSSTDAVPDVANAAFHLRTGGEMTRHMLGRDAEIGGDRIFHWSGGVVKQSFPEKANAPRQSVEVRLDAHQTAVADEARKMADALKRESDNVFLDVDLFAYAGQHHDDGKAHDGWQLHVNGGNPARLSGPKLAGRYVRSPLSRLPPRWRHEAESCERPAKDTPPLVRWLIATHHGHARPFWPTNDHGIGLAQLMDTLQDEHGFWRLALFETVLRCADRTVSKREMEAPSEPAGGA